jgi:hypothetical protein
MEINMDQSQSPSPSTETNVESQPQIPVPSKETNQEAQQNLSPETTQQLANNTETAQTTPQAGVDSSALLAASLLGGGESKAQKAIGATVGLLSSNNEAEVAKGLGTALGALTSMIGKK